ncbi:hypothetical protein K4L44_09190 [Halosquirtibacter laminarini]|uniref:Uncharacterized protein n=1 Tax=Halosquirtibacter laminarini TaxID=3374600 RepID=A0AC61NBH1_9BACT|nr:hypothetical protein K4L44_09190 [Prolixibacteraceae bacterium]
MKYITHTLFLFLLLSTIKGQSQNISDQNNTFSVVDFTLSSDNKVVYMAQKDTKSVVCYQTATQEKVHTWNFNDTPTGITIYKNKLYVTTSYSKGMLYRIDLLTDMVEDSIRVGMGACDPTINKNGTEVIVCNRYTNKIAKISLPNFKHIASCEVEREPNHVVYSKDEKYLFVTNFLPCQRADIDTVAADLSVIDAGKMKVVKQIKLTNGSNALRDMVLTPDGKYLLVTHNLGRFQVPTSQLQQGWMNTSAMSVIDIQTLDLLGTVLLDESDHGAAGTWGVDCDDHQIIVTHSGTHDMSVIDYVGFIEKFEKLEDKESLSYDLRFLNGIRERISLDGNGPRNVVLNDGKVWVMTYFSDRLNCYNIADKHLQSYAMNPDFKTSIVRHGEQLFNDASYCLESWQSCNGCHPSDARTDGMNWDLLNDGIGNPKNCKSMLYSHRTAPAMITGIRPDAETAVRAGFQHIQFAKVSDSEAKAVDAYLKSLIPLPSPYLVNGELSKRAQKGEKLFVKFNCNYCHSGSLFTDGKMHRIGEVEFEKGWDTPTLVEVWRTGPYLFDGRAKTIEEIFSVHHHGLKGKKVKKKDIEYLSEYVKSL